jgi:L-lactate dehydrogenase (cytochrome)
MLLLQDFEEWAERVLSPTAWAYYRSAADEEKSKSSFAKVRDDD